MTAHIGKWIQTVLQSFLLMREWRAAAAAGMAAAIQLRGKSWKQMAVLQQPCSVIMRGKEHSTLKQNVKIHIFANV